MSDYGGMVEGDRPSPFSIARPLIPKSFFEGLLHLLLYKSLSLTFVSAGGGWLWLME
jgi:hypothetical protein